MPVAANFGNTFIELELFVIVFSNLSNLLLEGTSRALSSLTKELLLLPDFFALELLLCHFFGLHSDQVAYF